MAFSPTASGSFALAFAAAVATTPAARAADLAIPGQGEPSATEQCVMNAVESIYSSGPFTYTGRVKKRPVYVYFKDVKEKRTILYMNGKSFPAEPSDPARFENASGDITIDFRRGGRSFKAEIRHVSQETPPRTTEITIDTVRGHSPVHFAKNDPFAPRNLKVDYTTLVKSWQDGMPQAAVFIAGPEIRAPYDLVVTTGRFDGSVPWRDTHAGKLHQAVGMCGLEKSDPSPR